MRVPKRRSEQNRRKEESGPLYVTADGLAQLKEEVRELRRGVPDLVKEVSRTGAFGDFSENAEYQWAKQVLRQTYGRIARLKRKIARAVVIEKERQMIGVVELGSIVTLEVRGKRVVYKILGSEETDPLHGRISYNSPLGALIMGRLVGERVELKTQTGSVEYHIVAIR
jgi:transcription elongation factor GreA